MWKLDTISPCGTILNNAADLKRDDAVTYAYCAKFPSDVRVSDGEVAAILCFPTLRRLTFIRAEFSDAQLAEIAKLPRLEELALLETSIGAEGVRFLTRLRTLRALNLSETKIADESFERLVALRDLALLNLAGTRRHRRRGLPARRPPLAPFVELGWHEDY